MERLIVDSEIAPLTEGHSSAELGSESPVVELPVVVSVGPPVSPESSAVRVNAAAGIACRTSEETC